jgi:hypothetical protein
VDPPDGLGVTLAVWGIPTDPPTAAVIEALAEAGLRFGVIDQREVLDTSVELRVDGELRGRISTPSLRLDLRDLTAVFARPSSSAALPWVRTGAERRMAADVDAVLAVWAELTSALVVNRPSAGASNGSKPFQLALLRSCGFDVPDTVVTTCPEEARAFRARHGSVAVKSVSAWRSRVRRRSDDQGLDRVRACPVQLQEWVTGLDVRVHVVGDEVFACDVVAEGSDDYRFAEPTMRARELPPDVAARCRDAARALGLPLAGIDLRLTPEGRWVCFEANPAPAFDFFSRRTGQPIASAVAALLGAGEAAGGPRLPATGAPGRARVGP